MTDGTQHFEIDLGRKLEDQDNPKCHRLLFSKKVMERVMD